MMPREGCWNEIGVRGDASCPELKQHIHCHNCPVYSDAAVRLLDSDLPDGYLADWTAQVAAEEGIDALGTHSVLVFRIGEEWLALPTSAIKEVADPRPIHSLPHRRNGVVLGVANVRGELLVCVSLGHVLGLEQSAETQLQKHGSVHPRLLVIHRAVFPVDEVSGTHRAHSRELTDVPATVAKATASYTKAMLSWQQKSIGLLDERLLLDTLTRSLA
jgi:chemotaxis-related protein WspD